MTSASASQVYQVGIRPSEEPRGLAKAKVRDKAKVDSVFTFTDIAYNRIRLPTFIRKIPV
jgi:hypothetical protein